jgi:iron complex outermembrane receptor protein
MPGGVEMRNLSIFQCQDRQEQSIFGVTANFRFLAQAIFFGCILALILSPAPGMAQEDEEELDEIVVLADPVGLGEHQESDSMFGLQRSLLDTPRSISVVGATTMERYAIYDIDDLITTTPGTFGGSFFGVPGAVSIRGDIGENYFRGFKRVVNNGLFPTPVRSSDRIEIIRGPSPAIYGAARIGGLMNFMPRTTRASGLSADDGASGYVSVTGGSFSKQNISAQFDLPFLMGDRETGVSAYAELEDSEHFFEGREPQHELFQLTFNHELPGNARLEFGGMYFHSEGYFQTPGWNRLTQDLVDNGTYITGRDTDIVDLDANGRLTPDEIDAVVGTFFGTSNIRTLIDFGVFGVPPAYNLDTGVGTGSLDPSNVFLAPGNEIQEAENLTFYLDFEKDFGESSSVKLQFFYDDLDGDLSQSTGFAAQHDTRATEFRLSYETSFTWSDSSGMDLFATASRRDYTSELRENFLSGYLVIDRRDLLAGPFANDILDTPFTDEPNGIGWDSNFDSEWSDTGIALVTDIHLFNNLSILLNARYDDYDAESIDTGNTVFDPSLANTLYQYGEGDTSYSASISYSFNGQVVPYVTYAEGSSIQQNSNGGISPGPVRDGNILAGSDLIEVGVKFSLLDEALNGSLAWYNQERTVTDPFGNVDIEKGEGVEFELRYLISENWTLTGAATNQEFTISPPGACFSGRGEFVVIPPTAIPPGSLMFGTPLPTLEEGYGGIFAALNASCLPELQDGYRRNAIPETVLSAFGTYTSNEASWGMWGATFGGTYVSETGGKILNAIVFPSYEVFRGALFADFGRFNITATVDNVFDEEYFVPLQGVYEEVAGLPGTGRAYLLTARVNF